MTAAFRGIQSFYGDGPAGDSSNTGVGDYSESFLSVMEAASPPRITLSPLEQTFGTGQTVTLQIAVDGTGPFQFQWQFNGTNLPGATNEILTLTNSSAAIAGIYRVVVSNAVGSITSSPTTLRFFGSLQMYAGMLISGSLGDRYRIEYADVLGAATNWVPVVTNFYHPGGVTVFFDTNSPGLPRRFYRSVFLTNAP
jgi:hypothetical protein